MGLLFSLLLLVAFTFLHASITTAVVVLLIALASAATISIAWMRPAHAGPEHHPKIDKLFDDTAP